MPLPRGSRAVNLGCGVRIAPGWINLDNSPNARLSKYPRLRWLLWKARILSDKHYAVRWPRSVVIHDLRKQLPFDDASIDYVYSSHFLEHLSRDHAMSLLVEVFRVLRPGGFLRLVVPGLAFGIRRYSEAIALNPDDANAADELLNWLQLNKVGHRDPHLWMYDAPSLTSRLHICGFVNVVVQQFREGRVPDCDVLDSKPGESLHIEAQKPEKT